MSTAWRNFLKVEAKFLRGTEPSPDSDNSAPPTPRTHQYRASEVPEFPDLTVDGTPNLAGSITHITDMILRYLNGLHSQLHH